METSIARVIISRHWDNPEIIVCIDAEKIEVMMSVQDFCKALVAEIQHPIFIQTRNGLEDQCLKMIDTVLNKAKESTRYV